VGAKRAAALALLVGSGLGALALAPASASAAPSVSCGTTAYQKQVEGYLAKLGGYGPVTVDGKQSAGDCAAVKKFQARFGIKPGNGSADATTYDVGKRLTATSTGACNAKKSGITFCVDLTHQTTWVMKDGKIYRPPTITRTGKKGYATPAGTFTVNKRTRKEWSDPYHVWLPYWQRFIGGRGFHQTTTYIHDKSIGSHGCVNLLPVDAQAYWGIGKLGMTVKVFGRRPGT
jgi:peptidoglycan hydrolase-like protein with peptidoglycan-binding domain